MQVSHYEYVISGIQLWGSGLSTGLFSMNSKRLVIFFLVLCFSSLAGAASDESEEFDNRLCTSCHGVEGRGDEGLQAPRLAGIEDWYLIRQLENFRNEIRGVHQGDIDGADMRAAVATLSDEDISSIVEWVSTLEFRSPQITIDGDLAAGLQLYQSCRACHGADGKGIESLGAPALAGQNDWYLVKQLRNFQAGYRGSDSRDAYGRQMAAMAKNLVGEQQIVDVVSYINTFYGGP